jgi:hypothetical protein
LPEFRCRLGLRRSAMLSGMTIQKVADTINALAR